MNSFAQGRDPQQLDCTRWLYLACTSCTKFNRSNQARSESILGSHRTTTWRTYSFCSACLDTCEGYQKWHSFCWRILLSSPLQFIIFKWVSVWSVLICIALFGSVEQQYGWKSKHVQTTNHHMRITQVFRVDCWRRMTRRQDPSTRTLWPLLLTLAGFMAVAAEMFDEVGNLQTGRIIRILSNHVTSGCPRYL